MKIKKPAFWDKTKPNTIAKILYPLSLIYGLFVNLNIKNSHKTFKIKTICIGNIYIGGTGKSSLSIEIKRILDKKNFKSCFIKKGNPKYLDEVKLLKKRGCVYDEKSRFKSLLKAENDNFDYAIFDDGLHEKDINYDLKIVCFNKKNWIGNGLILPAGPLRESINNIKNYEIVFFIGNNENCEIYEKFLRKKNDKLKFFNAEYIPVNIKKLDLEKSYFVFSGIGNHNSFLDMLKNNKVKIADNLEFPDHYIYKQNDIKKIIDQAKKKNLGILTTEKDMQRIDDFYKSDINEIKIDLKINNEEIFSELISKI